MTILVIHNRYLNLGGEDSVVDGEIKNLRSRGIKVIFYERKNAEIKTYSIFKKIMFFLRDVFWSKKSYDDVLALIKKHSPDLVHIHNTFLVISPSVYSACFDVKVPIVQSFHNYRFICPIGVFFRGNQVCEKCRTQSMWAAVYYVCWKQSRVLSYVLVRVIKRILKITDNFKKVDCCLTLTDFSRQKYAKAHFQTKDWLVQPAGVELGEFSADHDGYAVFIGRTVDYKGINLVLESMASFPDWKLKVVGSSDNIDQYQAKYRESNIDFLGSLAFRDTVSVLSKAKFLVFPSQCYETFGCVIVEAYSLGKPVVVSDIGASKELVCDGRTGLLFESGNVTDLRSKMEVMFMDDKQVNIMGKSAYEEYLQKYTWEVSGSVLISRYKNVIAKRGIKI